MKNPLITALSGCNVTSTAQGGTVSATLVPAPNGIGNAVQMDFTGATSTGTPKTFMSISPVSAINLVAGDTIEASCMIKVEGYGGVGNPIGLYAIVVRTAVTGSASLAYGFGRSFGVETENPNCYTARIFTPPLIAQTGDYLNGSGTFEVIPDYAIGASFRLTVWAPRVDKNKGTYTNKYPWLVTSSNTPTGPQGIALG